MESNTNRSKFLLHAILTVTLLWIGSGFLIYYASDNWADRGTIGDMFGAVNALFSGLAFAGLMYTIILQREEIKLNRDEIVNNRKELAKSVKTQQKSQAASSTNSSDCQNKCNYHGDKLPHESNREL